jgi:hypothetical protein
MSTENQTLFCPGIPGAGKTILTSIVIDHLHTLFNGHPKFCTAYLYCNFRRQDEQRVEELVANLVKQLASGLPTLPEALKTLYGRYSSKEGAAPLLRELAEALRSVVSLYEGRVFIVVDALDECRLSDSCRSNLLSTLLGLQSGSGSKVNIFVTSRPGISDIAERFAGHPSLEILASRQDIERYLEGHMGELHRVVKSGQDLRREIITTIVDAVDGM